MKQNFVEEGFIRRVCIRLKTRLGANPAVVILLAGMILPLAYPPDRMLPVFYVSFGLAFYLAWCHHRALKKLFLLGFLFGFGQFFTGFYWISEAFLVEAEQFLWALPFAVTLLPAGLALFSASAFGLWGLLMQRVVAPPRGVSLVALAVFWAVAEYARASLFTGLPWNLPVMGWAGWLYLAQPVGVVGIHGVGLIALLGVALLFGPFSRWPLAAGILVLSSMVYSGFVLRAPSPPPAMDAADAPIVLVVQPNIDQREKWQVGLQQTHIDKIFKLTQIGLQKAPRAKIIIWPETAVPALIDEGGGFDERMRASLPSDRLLITGAVRRQPGPDRTDYFNATMVWRTDGQLLARADKHHLVPFGEYLPMQNLLEAMGLQQLTGWRGGYSAGPPHARLQADGLPMFIPLVCYEGVFPYLSASHTVGAPRPAWLVNVTNDGWFGQSRGPGQHLAHARLRAIEQGLPLIRSANTGVSAAFDARGRQLQSLPLNQAGVFALPLPPALPATFYARYGDRFFWLFVAGLGLWCGWRLRKTQKL